jgi:hypothetical protein
MKKKPISLAQEVTDYSAVEPPQTAKSDEDLPKKKVFPSIYISDAPPALFELPDEGEAVISFRVREKGMRERDGEKTCNCELEIISITPMKMESKAMEDSTLDSDKAIDEYFSEEG